MITIFGASGFIGTALCGLFDKKNISYKKNKIDLTTTIPIVGDGDTIVMIAAKTAEHGNATHLTNLNIRMAANVLRACEGKRVPHCVYVSSDSVYGKVSGLMNESTPIQPDTLYGMMHVIREQMFKERFKNLCVLRPCAVYGKGDTHNAYGISQFTRSALSKGLIELFGDGEEYRSNIHVDDLAAIIAKSAAQKITGTYNANCGVAYSFKEIANLISQSTGAIIRSKPRTIPIAHRYVDNSALVKAFPEINIRRPL